MRDRGTSRRLAGHLQDDRAVVLGLVGGLLGAGLATHLSKQRGALQRVFAGVVFAVAAYMLYRSLIAPH